MIFKTYKQNRKIVCYIEKTESGLYKVKTGKPSDSACISWTYNTLAEAEATAQEYHTNRTTFFK